MFWKRIVVGDQERILVTKNGRFARILEPGEYGVFAGPFGKVETETHNIRNLVFQSTWADFLVKQRADIVENFFTVVETSDQEVAIIVANGKLFSVIPPGKRALFWRGAAEIAAEIVNTAETPEVPKAKLPALERLGREALVTLTTVEDSRVGLLFLDGSLARTLGPGKYGFWSVAGAPRVEVIDLRLQTLEIPGQEILTKDKVSIRVNILAEYQVTDAVKAKQVVKDSTDYLYRTLQLAVRQTLGKKTLEEILADKTDVDESVAVTVRAEMEKTGVLLGAIALKDIILPGDMREILNQVVTAEKQAQATLIRRREETAATRSLLNTAKLMEDNPILVRLKELETLEKLVEKVDRLTVSNGFDGLLDNLVTMKVAGKSGDGK
jgi:regulator of protease activity HflC (stomatin/prohibitin superfamily)